MASDEKSQSGADAWIFLSHSSKDFEKVHEIRNELEKRGHKPVMFYLKCLENDNTMLPGLLRREIAAREWFILCDSPNAQASRYVRDEVELIKSMEGKTVEVADFVSHTWLQKLVKEFTADPSAMWQLQAAYGDPTSAQLSRAQEYTRHMRERGEVRVPGRAKRRKFLVKNCPSSKDSLRFGGNS